MLNSFFFFFALPVLFANISPSALAASATTSVGISDYSSRKPGYVTLPARGGSYVDPVFGTEIIRVTDSTDGQRCFHAYSYWRAFNSEGNQMLINCDGVTYVYGFDPARGKVLGRTPLLGATSPKIQFEGASWSYTQPHILYALDNAGRRLWSIDLTMCDPIFTLIRDFSDVVPSTEYLAQLDVSNNSNVFTFHTRNRSTGKKLDAFVYDRAQNKVWKFNRGTYEVDETKVTEGGGRVMVSGSTKNEGWMWWDYRAGTATRFDLSNPAHNAGGHAALGYTFLVNGDGFNTGISARSYDNMTGTGIRNILQYKRTNGSLNWSIADHTSLRQVRESYVVVSTYAGDGTWQAFEDEIVFVNTDGSGFVRLAHTRSYERASDSTWRYYAQPRAVVDKHGRYVTYTSDLGSSTRLDVMILKIPNELWTTRAPWDSN